MAWIKVLKKSTLLIPSLQTGFVMSTGDIISQTIIEKKNFQNIEWIRPVRFFGMGFFFVAPCLRTWFGILDKNIKGRDPLKTFKKVAIDQSLFAPSFLAAFLVVNGSLQRKSFNDIKIHIKNDYWNILKASWMLWPAVQVVNFSSVPLRHQVLVIQIVAVFWNTYLAWKINQA